MLAARSSADLLAMYPSEKVDPVVIMEVGVVPAGAVTLVPRKEVSFMY